MTIYKDASYHSVSEVNIIDQVMIVLQYFYEKWYQLAQWLYPYQIDAIYDRHPADRKSRSLHVGL